MKARYIRPEICDIETEYLMDNEVIGVNGSMVANPNKARGFDTSFYSHDFFFTDNEDGANNEETLESFIKKAHYNVWEEE